MNCSCGGRDTSREWKIPVKSQSCEHLLRVAVREMEVNLHQANTVLLNGIRVGSLEHKALVHRAAIKLLHQTLFIAEAQLEMLSQSLSEEEAKSVQR